MLVYISRNGICTWDFPIRELLDSFLTSSSLGGMLISVFVSTCGRRALASALVSAGLLRTKLRCSSHLFRLAGLSVMSVVPSTLNNGDALDDCGP